MTGSSPTPCRGCGAAFRVGSRFCAACGLPTPSVEQARRRAFHDGGRQTRAAASALAIVVTGVLGVVALSGLFAEDVDPLLHALLTSSLLIAVGGLATRRLGRGALRETLPIPCKPSMLALGAGVGLLSYGFGWAYVELLTGVLDLDAEPAASPPLAVLLLTVVLLPAVVEEWLCRGVSWTALKRLSGPGTTLVASAALFAILHGLEGLVFAFPHRFVGGLLLGFVRARSGSLAPAVLGHATNNLLAVSAL